MDTGQHGGPVYVTPLNAFLWRGVIRITDLCCKFEGKDLRYMRGNRSQYLPGGFKKWVADAITFSREKVS